MIQGWSSPMARLRAGARDADQLQVEWGLVSAFFLCNTV